MFKNSALREFNFFNSHIEQDTQKYKWKSLLKRMFKVLNLSVFLPATLYCFVKTVPELANTLPLLLESVPSERFTGLFLTVYSSCMLWLMIKQLLKVGYEPIDNSIFIYEMFSKIVSPLLIVGEFFLIIYAIPTIWNFLWPVIR